MSKGQRLKNKVSIVTGATSGIGEATAILFAQEGAKVTVVGRNEERGKEVVWKIRENGGEALLVLGDVTKTSTCQRMVKETVEKFGKLDILIHSAGTSMQKKIIEHTEEDYDYIMDLNVKSSFLACKYAIPEMIKNKGGSIVNVSSTAGIVGRPKRGAYCTSKGAINMLTRQSALDYAKDNIRINVICPGSVDTPLRWRLAKETGDAQADMREYAKIHILGRVGEPIEIANAILFFASDEASFITGTIFPVDGGHTVQ